MMSRSFLIPSFKKQLDAKAKTYDILPLERSVKEIMNISIDVGSNTARKIIYQIIKNNLSENEASQMTKLFFISESIENNSDVAIEFLADVGLLHFLRGWVFLPEEQAQKVDKLLTANAHLSSG